MKKSAFCTRECEVLGHSWSSKRSLKLPDRRVADLMSIEPPNTLAKVRILYIPHPEDPLILRVDAAGAGVGAILLAQPNPDDDQDVRPVAYYSKAFDGQQGTRPSWWLESFGAKEAVAALYHIIGGRANIYIETDSSTVLSMHNSDRDPNTHDLPRFAAELSSLGIQAVNMRHRPLAMQRKADREALKAKTAPSVPFAIPEPSLVAAVTVDNDDDDDTAADPDVSDSVPTNQETVGMQQADTEIKRIASLCRSHQDGSDKTGRGGVEPYSRMRVEEGGLLQYYAYTKEPGFVAAWLPYCPPAPLPDFIRRVHRAIAHAGIDRTLA
ncbi:hypothetical protein GQ42DRAFT_121109, partial [Ramicandelaber brevisporus]